MKNRGVTLVEILATIVIGSLLLVLTFKVFEGFRARQALDTASQGVARLLDEARSKTVASENDSRYGVNFASTTVTLFKGSVFNTNDPSNKVLRVDSYVVISNLSLANGATSTIFDRLTGATSQYGTTTISLIKDANVFKSVVIGKTGLVEVK